MNSWGFGRLSGTSSPRGQASQARHRAFTQLYVMAESPTFDATSSGASRRAQQGSVGMSTQSGPRGGPPPRKDPGFRVDDPAAQPAVGGGATGKRSAARANTNAMMSQRGAGRAPRPPHPWLDFPPAFEYAVSRQVSVSKAEWDATHPAARMHRV